MSVLPDTDRRVDRLREAAGAWVWDGKEDYQSTLVDAYGAVWLAAMPLCLILSASCEDLLVARGVA